MDSSGSNDQPSSLANDVVLSVRGVSKKFCKHLRRSMAYGIKELTQNLLGISPGTTALRKDEFWAIKDVSFDLRRGEVLGLIGMNGSGKTTLLRLLAGIFPSDKGEILVRGKVGALIAVGAGFHGYMTGRENIYLNGSILGMKRKEIDNKLQSIVDFADIGDFLDAPVATYSSGMRIRLGFAIATAQKPDLLLLDEILAVGDRRFIAKCYDRIGDVRANGATVFVSHNMVQINRICTSVLLVEKGQAAYYKNVQEGIRKYNTLCSVANTESFVRTSPHIEFMDFTVSAKKISWNDDLRFRVDFTSTKELTECQARLLIVDKTGQDVAEWRGENYGKTYRVLKGRNVINESVSSLRLRDNTYDVTFVLTSSDGFSYLILANRYCSIEMEGVGYGVTPIQL